jgi:hypothetical protein
MRQFGKGIMQPRPSSLARAKEKKALVEAYKAHQDAMRVAGDLAACLGAFETPMAATHMYRWCVDACQRGAQGAGSNNKLGSLGEVFKSIGLSTSF